MLRIISWIVLAATLLCTQGASQDADMRGSTEDKNTFATNECFAKGGIGIINTNLYIDLKSAKNELRLSAGNRWIGQGAPTPEVVIFFENRIWSPPVLPDGFDISKAVVISFEGNRVRFFGFGTMSGGYYKRISRN